MADNVRKIEFKSKVVDKKPTSIVMEVEVGAGLVDKEIANAFNGIQKQARVPGFRQGKAPMDMIKEKFVLDAKDRAVENVIRGTVLDALEKEKFMPLDMPIVDEFDYEIGKDLKYRFTAECHPEFDVKDYKGIPVKKEIFKITDASLVQSLDALRDQNAKLVASAKGIVTEQSFVSVDYDGFDDKGVAIADITAKNHLLDLASENTVKGFKDALKGAKIGDERDAKIEYPKDYPNKTIAGKTVSFKTKVIEIKEKELPELNDDFAKDMGTENLEDLKKKVTEAIEAEEKRRQDNVVEKQIIDYLVEKNSFEVPKTLVDAQKKKLLERMKDYMQKQGAPKDFIDQEAAKDQDKYNEEAKKNVRLSYVLNSIVEKEKLEVNDEDLKAEKERMLASSPNKKEAVDKYFAEHKDNIAVSLKESKLFKYLLDNAKITETQKDMPLK